MNIIAAAKQSHPAIDLLARYKAIFQAAWQARHELAGPKRLADEAAFLPAALRSCVLDKRIVMAETSVHGKRTFHRTAL